MRTIAHIMRALFGREEGQTLTEYGLLLFFIAVIAIVAVTLLGENVSTMFSSIADSLSI
jgi:pilus assembly protein Flp/PilA